MNEISWSEFKKLNGDKIQDMLPLSVLYEGQPWFVVSHKDDVIVISDLHPRVRNRLKALEGKARVGMPKPQKIEITPTQND